MPKAELNKTGRLSADSEEVLEVDEWYDLLPIEKKLIAYSLGIGVTLLVIFIIVFRVLK